MPTDAGFDSVGGQDAGGSASAEATTPRNPTKRDIRRWRHHLAEERIEAATYRNLAKRETGQQREVLLGLAEAEHRHEQHWLDLLGEHAYPPPRPRPSARLLATLAGRFGSIFTLALAQQSEQRTSYDEDIDATSQMAADEHIHGEIVRSLAATQREKIAGNFRAAVFGINDGLISNLALILGVAGAGMDTGWILATGISGLLAGSLSMAAGEWVSVSGQRELLAASAPDPMAERSVTDLDVNANELVLLFRARGESEEDARRHAAAIFESLEPIVDTDSRIMALHLRIADSGSGSGSKASPAEAATAAAEAVGKPLPVALSSFLAFALGALIPLLPFIFGMSGISAIVAAAVVVSITLVVTGGLVGVLSGNPPWKGALRQLFIGVAAATVTYVLGTLVGGVV